MSYFINRLLIPFSSKIVAKRLITFSHGKQFYRNKITFKQTIQPPFSSFNNIKVINQPFLLQRCNFVRYFGISAPENKIQTPVPPVQFRHIIVQGFPIFKTLNIIKITTITELIFAISLLPYLLNTGLPFVSGSVKTAITIAAIATLLTGPTYYSFVTTKRITEIVTHSDGTVKLSFIDGLFSSPSKTFQIHDLESEHVKNSKSILLKVKNSNEIFVIEHKIIPPSEELLQFLNYLPQSKQEEETEKLKN